MKPVLVNRNLMAVHDQLKNWLDPSEEKNIVHLIRVDCSPELYPSACKWFLDKEIYREWKDGSTIANFCITGGPGTGKSTLVANIVDDLLGNKPDACILYFFCRLDETAASKVRNVVRTLVYQLCSRYAEVEMYLGSLLSKKNSLDLDEVKLDKLMRDILIGSLMVVPASTTLYVLIDALNEMNSTSEEQERFLNILVNLPSLQFKGKLKISCLFTAHTRHRILNPSRSDVEHHEITVTDTLSDMKTFVRMNLTTSSEKLKTAIVNKAHGSFIWTKFILPPVEETNTTEAKENLVDSRSPCISSRDLGS